MFSRRKYCMPLLGSVFVLLFYTIIDRSTKFNSSTLNFQHDENSQREEDIKNVQEAPTLTKSVKRSGLYQYNQDLKGSIFDIRGVFANFTSKITSELVYSFSPSTEEMFASKLVDPNHEQKIFANSPAMIWHKDRFIVIMRMWLDKEETLKKVQNTFSDNYFFTRQFTQSMEPLDNNGRVLGMPFATLPGVGDGPIEPRMFPFYNQTYISYNGGVAVGEKFVDTTMLWNLDEDKFVMPEVTNGQPQLGEDKSVPRDKHWSPYTYRNEVYMIYSLDPLRILKCDHQAKCELFQNAAPPGYAFNDVRDCLRGGTPTIQYKDDYYITIAHSTLFRTEPEWKRYYTIHLLVLKTSKAKHQLLYMSDQIVFHPELMSKVPMVRKQFIIDDFFFPVSLLLENDDSIVLGGHINDHSSYLFRVRGLKVLMDKVMQLAHSVFSSGPDVGFLHRLNRQLVSVKTGFTFIMVKS